jgi:hypothetical protein
MNVTIHMPPGSYDALVDQPLLMLNTGLFAHEPAVGDEVTIRAADREPFTVRVTSSCVVCERVS